MLIDGKAIAQSVLDNLSKKVQILKEDGITPHLAVILIGDDASSKSYVRQKEIKAEQIGAITSIKRFDHDFSQEKLLTLIKELNIDPTVHGIIIQRPLPPHIDKGLVDSHTDAQKDIDSFRDDSPFDSPLALAILRILREIYASTPAKESYANLHDWLLSQRIVILGKGQTAGQPIIKFFDKEEIPLTVIDSKTGNKDELLINADIVISAIGKPGIITSSMLKDGVILLGVGMARGDDDKLHGDYNDSTVEDKASFYTPNPGGVGPVNVAMLLLNLIKAAETI